MNYSANKKIPFGQIKKDKDKKDNSLTVKKKGKSAATNRFNKNSGENGISDLRKFKVINVRHKLALLVLDYVNKDNQLKEKGLSRLLLWFQEPEHTVHASRKNGLLFLFVDFNSLFCCQNIVLSFQGKSSSTKT